MVESSWGNGLLMAAFVVAYYLLYRRAYKGDSWRKIGRDFASVLAFLGVFLVLPELVPAWKPTLYWIADELFDAIELVAVVILIGFAAWNWLATRWRQRRL